MNQIANARTNTSLNRRPRAQRLFRGPSWSGHVAALAALSFALGCGGGVDAENPDSSSSSSGTATTGAGGSSSTAVGSGGGGQGGSGTVQPDGCSDALASDITLGDISLFQVVGIDVLADGEPVAPAARTAPLIEGRAAVMRVYVEAGSAFTERELGARISMTTSAGTETFINKSTIAGSSTASEPRSGFVIDIPAAAIEGDATYSVAIVECGEATGSAPSDAARFPLQGEAELAPQTTGALKLHLVPFEIDGFVPDTSQPVLDGFRDAILSVYPVSAVEISVGPVVPDQYGGVLDMGGLLVDLGVQQEQVDQAPTDQYYYGLVTGAATRAEFCSGCPTGTSEDGGGVRAAFAVGAAFGDQKSEDTLIHELGHMHGLLHAPCGDPSMQDPLFPYAEAAITVEGYDFRTDSFVPADHKDMMSYCFPRWISDYNYNKLVSWVQFAQGWSGNNAQAAPDGQPDQLRLGSGTTTCFGH